ncbi:hypothetical protein [Streptomyces sp. NPDC007100]|uniref:hypothetical protein n=1 Tax=Streptomyces sp. NPDC007100 TaxID=3155602 RepID=UPI0033C411AA
MAAHRGAEGPLTTVLLLGPRLTLGAAAAAGTVSRAALRRLVASVVAAVVAQLDLDDLVSRVDVDRVADRVDVDRVADRVDVDRIARRVDLDALLDRVDMAALARQVLEEIDIGRIVRDTGGGMTVEALDAVRLRSARADRLVDAFTDRLLRRDGNGRTPL